MNRLAGDLGDPIERAADALARLDERLTRSEAALADGWRARAHLFDAQAILHLEGRLAALDDLVLRDAGMDLRPPTPDLQDAAAYLAARRTLARRNPAAALSEAGVRAFLGMAAVESTRPPRPDATPPLEPWAFPADDEGGDVASESDGGDDERPAPAPYAEPETDRDFADIDQLLARSHRALTEFNDLTSAGGRQRLRLSDPAYDASSRFETWFSLIDTLRGPAVVVCAVALDAWLALEPSEHRASLGFPLAATVLRQKGRARAHLPALALGLRHGRFRWRATDPIATRLGGVIAAIETSARVGMADLDKLSLARTAMLQRCQGKQKNARLTDLIDLFVASPLVTVAFAARALAVSPQAIDAMLKQLAGALPRELTGRKRYRAWGIV